MRGVSQERRRNCFWYEFSREIILTAQPHADREGHPFDLAGLGPELQGHASRLAGAFPPGLGILSFPRSPRTRCNSGSPIVTVS